MCGFATQDGATPLLLAAQLGQLECLKALLSASNNPAPDLARPCAPGGGATPLHAAVGAGRVEIVDALVAAGAPVNARDDVRASLCFRSLVSANPVHHFGFPCCCGAPAFAASRPAAE